MGVKLTTKQAAARLGVNASRVRQLVLAGKLPAEKFGHVLMIDEQDLKPLKRRKPGRPRKQPEQPRKAAA
jgi:excisionase family DNA binding protein